LYIFNFRHKVTEINIALGDKIKQGDVLLALQTEEDNCDKFMARQQNYKFESLLIP
jgi:multidrug resistance efflux pump